MTDKENKWIKFYPSLELPKERVSIAYATHDERGYRFAYGYFQFYNGTCGCFWKDGNEQPKVVKAEDIKYWMPIPSLDMQEEPISEIDFEQELYKAFGHVKDFTLGMRIAKRFYEMGRNHQEPISEVFEKALAEEWQGYIDRGAATVDALEDNTQELAFAKGFYRGASWQLKKAIKWFKSNINCDIWIKDFIKNMEE